MTGASLTADWNALAGAIAGSVLVPESAEYERARPPAMARFAAVRPAAIVRCRTADVAEALGLARRLGLELTVRSGGHCFAGRSSTQGVLIDVSPKSSIELRARHGGRAPAR